MSACRRFAFVFFLFCLSLGNIVGKRDHATIWFTRPYHVIPKSLDQAHARGRNGTSDFGLATEEKALARWAVEQQQ